MNENNLKLALTELMYKDADELMIENIPYEFSAEFEKRMSKLIKRRRKPYFRMINTVGKRAACIAIALFIASATTVMSVDALRNAVFNFFINVFSDHSDIKVIDDVQHPDTIEDIYEITYDLSDYRVDYKNYDEYQRFTVYLKTDTNTQLNFYQFTSQTFDMRINTEGAEITHLDINGYDTIYYFNNLGFHNLIWDNGKYIFMLCVNSNKKEAIQIAKSVQKVEHK